MKRYRHLLKTRNGVLKADLVSLLFCIHGLRPLWTIFICTVWFPQALYLLQKTGGNRLVIHTCLKSSLLQRSLKTDICGMFWSAYHNHELIFPGNTAEFEPHQKFAQLLRSLLKAKWIAYVKRPSAGPEQVIEYLGRYTHRVCPLPLRF